MRKAKVVLDARKHRIFQNHRAIYVFVIFSAAQSADFVINHWKEEKEKKNRNKIRINTMTFLNVWPTANTYL